MSRIRSPNYPAISLAEALERVSSLFAKEHQHAMSRDVALKGLGYSGANGASLSALSAVRKYGLLSKKGEDYKITERAIAILHPHSVDEKAEALNAAAREPSLFSELVSHFHGSLPSDDNLRSYLVRQGFSQSALGGVIQSFRDTMELVSPSGMDYGELSPADDKPVIREAVGMATGTSTSSARGIAKPMSVMFNGDRLEVSAILADAESVERLIRALEANKPLLPEKKEEAAN